MIADWLLSLLNPEYTGPWRGCYVCTECGRAPLTHDEWRSSSFSCCRRCGSRSIGHGSYRIVRRNGRWLRETQIVSAPSPLVEGSLGRSEQA